MKKSIILLSVLILFCAGDLSALTVNRPAGIPLDPLSVKNAVLKRDLKLNDIEAEILIYSYSTGKAVYSLGKSGELQVKEEPGEIEAMIKFTAGKNKGKKPMFIKGRGLDAASLTESLADEVQKALSPYIGS